MTSAVALEPPRTATPLWVAFGLALGPAATLGLARFAYALLLPAMRTDLAWSYAQAGTMNTVNALGYLLGSLFAARAATRWGIRTSFIASMAITAASLLLSALTRDFTALLVLRLIAGIASAVTLVGGAGLAAHAGVGDNGRPALILSIYFGGGGLGVVASALSVPLLMGAEPRNWPTGWVVLSLAGLAATALAIPAVRRAPAPERGRTGSASARWAWRFLLPCFISYFLFGAGYIAYMTFIIAFLRSEGFGTGAVIAFWSLLGGAGMATPFVWGPIFTRLRGGWGMALVLAVLTVGAALPLVTPTLSGAYASALVFGGSFLAVVAAMASFARKATPPAAWTHSIGALTTVFALGQCLGPVIAGALSDAAGGVGAGLILSAGILALGVIVACLQREPELA